MRGHVYTFVCPTLDTNLASKIVLKAHLCCTKIMTLNCLYLINALAGTTCNYTQNAEAGYISIYWKQVQNNWKQVQLQLLFSATCYMR